jgi:hypothetical protein
MLSKQCLNPDFWASPEFIILNKSCPDNDEYNGLFYIHFQAKTEFNSITVVILKQPLF